MASEKQVAANRQNGLKGGVKTPEGKAISRLNARKHSIFVTALTAEDSEEVCGYEDQLIASLRPAGRVEEMLVEKLALTWLRMQRCARAEAEYHSRTWEEPNDVWDAFAAQQLERKRELGMRGVAFKQKVFERMVKLIDLYDSRLTNQFLKLLHEIERLQLIRKGESGALAPGDKGESSDGAAEIANPVKPPAESADDAPAPAATQTSCPPSQPSSFVPSEDVAQPPSAVRNGLSEASQPRAVVPPTEQAAAPAPEKSQDAARQEAHAQTAI